MADLNTRIIISARDEASKVFKSTADNLKVIGTGAQAASAALSGALPTERIAGQVNALSGHLAELGRNAQLAGGTFAGLGSHFTTLAPQVGLTEKTFAALQERMLRTQAAAAAKDSLSAVAEKANLSKVQLGLLQAELGQHGAAFKSFGEAGSSAISKVAGGVLNLKNAIVALAAGGLIKEAISGWMDEEKASADLTRVSGAAYADLAVKLKALPTVLGDMAEKQDGVRSAMSAGVRETGKALEVYEAGAKAAKVTHQDLNSTVKAAAEVWTAYGGKIERASAITDAFLAMERQAGVRLEELQPVIGSLAKEADSLGISWEELAGAIIQVNKTSGNMGETAGQVRALMMAFTGASKDRDFSELIHNLGFSSAESMLKVLGLQKALVALSDRMRSSGYNLGQIFEKRSVAAAQDLTADGGSQYAAEIKAVREAQDQGLTQIDFGKWSGSTRAHMDEAINRISDLRAKLGEPLADGFSHSLEGLSDWLDKNQNRLVELGEHGAHALTAMVGPAAALAGNLADVATQLAKIPTPLLMAAMGAAVGGRVAGPWGAAIAGGGAFLYEANRVHRDTFAQVGVSSASSIDEVLDRKGFTQADWDAQKARHGGDGHPLAISATHGHRDEAVTPEAAPTAPAPPPAGLPHGMTSQDQAKVDYWSRFYGLPPELASILPNLIHTESGWNQFDPKTGKVLTSSKGALGLTQLMPGTAAQMGVDPLDREQNLQGGIKYLKWISDQLGTTDPKMVLAGYSAGVGNVRRYGGVPPFKETLDEIQKVTGEQASVYSQGAGGFVLPSERPVYSWMTGLRGDAARAGAGTLEDEFTEKRVAILKEYESSLAAIEERLSAIQDLGKRGAMADEARGLVESIRDSKLARIDQERAWADAEKFGLQAVGLGQSLGDPSKSYQGDMLLAGVRYQKAKQQIEGELHGLAAEIRSTNAENLPPEEKDKALKGYEGRQQELLERRKDLEELTGRELVDVRRKYLGDAAKLEAGYWQDRWASYAKDEQFVRQYAGKSLGVEAWLAEQRDKIKREQLETKLPSDSGFGTFMADKMSLDYGLYKSDIAKRQEYWSQLAQDVEHGVSGIENSVSETFGDMISDAMAGKPKKAMAYRKELAANVRESVASSASELIKTGIHNSITQPLLAMLTGAASGSPGGGRKNDSSQAAYGILGKDAAHNLGSATSSYGILGAMLGTSGAPSLISKIPTASGILTAFTGDSTSSGSTDSSSVTYDFGTPTVDSSGIGFAGGDSASAENQMVLTYMAQGFSAPLATQLVALQLGGGSAGTGSSGDGIGLDTVPAASSSSSLSLSNLASDAKTGYQAYSTLTGDNPLSSTINSFGSNYLGMGSTYTATLGDGSTVTGQAAMDAVSDGSATDLSVTGGTSLSSTLGAAGAAGGIGYLAGGLMSTQSPAASYVGAGTGALAGGIASLAGYGALASTGVGALVAIPAAALTAALTPSTTTTNTNGNNGITVDLTSPGAEMSGDEPLWGYMGFTSTTTGSFGQSSTSHFTEPSVADPATAKAWDTAMTGDTSQLAGSLNSLGVGTSALQSATFPVQFNVNAQNASQAANNVSNYMALLAIQASGLATAFENAAQPGEDYVDEINRIGAAYAATNVSAQIAGTSLANLSGATDSVDQGNWASETGQLMGSNSAVSSAFQTYASSQSQPAQLSNALSAYQGQANQAIGLIGNPDVTMGNFWSQYGQAMSGANGPMDSSTFQAWANAAQWMQQFDAAEQQAGQLTQQFNSLQISQLQEQITAVQDVKVVVDGLAVSIQSAESTYQSLANTIQTTLQGIQWNPTLSPNTPGQTYQQESAYWNQLSTTVQGEGPASVSYSQDLQKLTAFASTFLQTSKSYYGNSAAYLSDEQMVTGTLGALQAPIDQQLATLKSQLQDQDAIVNSAQAQIDQLQLQNQSLTILNSQITLLGQDTVTGFDNLTAQMAGISGVVSNLEAAYGTITASLTGLGIPGFSGGGDHAGGLSWVGETGRELMLTGPARILSHSQIGAMLAPRVVHSPDNSGAIIQSAMVMAAGFKGMHAKMDVNNAHLAAIAGAARRSAMMPARSR